MGMAKRAFHLTAKELDAVVEAERASRDVPNGNDCKRYACTGQGNPTKLSVRSSVVVNAASGNGHTSTKQQG